jgi:hypothetical protein
VDNIFYTGGIKTKWEENYVCKKYKVALTDDEKNY